MNKFFLLACTLLLSATGFAKSVTIDISSEVGFGSIKGFEDGVFVAHYPRLWDFYLGASSFAVETATMYCKKAGLKYVGHTELTASTEKIVKFEKVGDSPKFGYDMRFVTTVICQK